MKAESGDLSRSTTSCNNWIGSSTDKNPRVHDASLGEARLNEPNGCWARVKNGAFQGLYIADTGNNCVRFAHPDGTVQTLELKGIPDVRTTNPDDCADCEFNYGDNEEEKKE